jgi:hypothetical protein
MLSENAPQKNLSILKTFSHQRTKARITASSCLFWIIFNATAIAVYFMVSSTIVFAGQITLGWYKSIEPDVAGYKIYYGTASRNYTQSIKITSPDITTGIILNLLDGQTYYFAATAYNFGLIESDYSAEVSCTIASATTSIPTTSSSTTSLALTTTTTAQPITTSSTTIPDSTATTTTPKTTLCAVEAIYGENSEQTELLRQYRDRILSKTSEGQEIIKIYYKLSPDVNKLLQQRPLFKKRAKAFIDSMLPGIKIKVEENKKEP